MTTNFLQIVKNLNDHGWTVDGSPIDADKFLYGELGSADSSQKLSKATVSQTAFNSLTPALFGEQSFIKKANMGMILQAYSLSDIATDPISDSDMLYIMRSEIPMPETYDYQTKILDKIKADKTKAVLVLSAGPAVVNR
jgi:hypothetical protein